jgi:hypothetical protein
MFNKLRTILGLRTSDSVQEYGLLFFDHLNCDYRLVESKITDQNDKEIITSVLNKRNNRQITWEDIRAFDLTVLKYQDFDTIKGKVSGLRQRFQSILNPDEIELFKSSPKLDLDTITEDQINKLQGEYSGLIREFCIRYSYMASREGLRSLLLRSGAALTMLFCLLVIIIGFVIFQYNSNDTPDKSMFQEVLNTSLKNLFAFATLLMVVFAGITGAFVSMQQRIQTANYNGDPIKDLSILTHGWLSIFLSPLSGAIFAVILYLFFAGGLLSGAIFPTFIGLSSPQTVDIAAKSEIVISPSPDKTTNSTQNSQRELNNSNTNNQANNITNGNSNSISESNSAQSNNPPENANPTQSPNETNNQTQAADNSGQNISQAIPFHLVDFLTTTGPASSKDFALLLIWCFIAGFAERFVPDSLNRLVNNESKENKKS